MTIAFPVALHGTEAEVRKRIEAASRAWADDLRKGTPLRPLESREVPAGTPIFCSDVSALTPGQPQWRLYGLLLVRAEVRGELPAQVRDRARGALEAEFLQFPAGLLWLNVGQPEPNSLAIVRARIDALLSNWSALNMLSYVDRQLQPQSLAALIEDRYQPFFDIWLDPQETGPLSDRLRTAIETALAASEGDTRNRMAAAIRNLATKMQRIEDPRRFDDREWVERQLAVMKPAAYESAKTGADLTAVVYEMHRRGERDAGA